MKRIVLIAAFESFNSFMVEETMVFESALELISCNKIGAFAIGVKPKGMPKTVKFILDKFSNGREEDKLAGYISFLKLSPNYSNLFQCRKYKIYDNG